MKNLFCIFLGLFPAFLYAQSADSDQLLWASVKVKKDLTQRWSLSGEYQLRLEQKMSTLRGHYFSVQTEYDVFKFLSTGVEYRLVSAPDVIANRIQVSLTGKAKIKKVGFSLRSAYQRQFEDFVDADASDRSREYWRNRFQVKWKFVKHWEVYGVWEPFYRIEGENSKFDRLRYMAGVEWEFINDHSLDLAYIYQPQINRKNPTTYYIFSVAYAWKIPAHKKTSSKQKS